MHEQDLIILCLLELESIVARMEEDYRELFLNIYVFHVDWYIFL